MFANNPVYRGEAIGSYDLVFNAILNYDHLRQPAATPAGSTRCQNRSGREIAMRRSAVIGPHNAQANGWI